MTTGRYTADLEPGDTFDPMEYDVTPFALREYCHSVQLDQEIFQGGAQDKKGVMRQAWPVPLVHMDKLRFYHRHCPEGSGPNARIHYEFDAQWSGRLDVGDRVTAEGRVLRRFMRREREYMEIEVTLRSARNGRVVVRYKDTTVLSYRTAAEVK
jgi:hypothetical protein